jgi:hypothetical protein
MKKSLLYALAVILLGSCNLFAQWNTNTQLNTTVSDLSGISETLPICVASSDGKTFVSWFASNTSGGYNAMLQLIDSNGFAVWPLPLVVSNQPQGSALYLHDFTADSAGNALFAFQDIRNGNTETVIYKISPSGVFLWGANGIPLHDINATFEAAPRIGIFPNNDVIVTWSASSGNNKWIAWQVISEIGQPNYFVPLTIDSPTENYSRAVPIPSGNSDYIICFVKETGNFPALSSLCYAQKFDLLGLPLWGPVNLSPNGIGFAAVPKVISDGANGCIVAFNSGAPGNPALNDAYIQRISSGGSKVFGASGLEIITLNSNHRFAQDLLLDSTGSKIYTLLKITDSSQNGAGVFFQCTDTSGGHIFGATGVEISPISVTAPCEPYCMDADNSGIYATYKAGTFNAENLYCKKMDYSGGTLFSNPVMLSNPTSQKSRVTSNRMKNRQLIISWEDSRTDQGIYIQNMLSDGSVGIITQSKEKVLHHSALVYPSLFSNHFNLMSDKEDFIQAFDVAGRLLGEIKVMPGIQVISTDTWPSGTIFLNSGNGWCEKIVKINP